MPGSTAIAAPPVMLYPTHPASTETEVRLLDAAEAVFAARGFHAASTAEIARGVATVESYRADRHT